MCVWGGGWEEICKTADKRLLHKSSCISISWEESNDSIEKWTKKAYKHFLHA